MNLFSPVTLKWWQVSIFKLSLVSFGVFVGATWPNIFEKWLNALIVIFIVTTLYLLPFWWKQWTKNGSNSGTDVQS